MCRVHLPAFDSLQPMRFARVEGRVREEGTRASLVSLSHMDVVFLNLSPSSSSLICTRWYIILPIPLSIVFSIKPLIHGMQQQPHNARIATATAVDISKEVISVLHFQNHFSIIFVNGSSIPAFSANSFNKAVKPFNALIMLSSGAVLSKIHFQHPSSIIF